MAPKAREQKSAQRVARQRITSRSLGTRRVEVTVGEGDVPLVKALASALQGGGEDADRLRAILANLTTAKQAQTGKDLVASLRASPLVGEDLTFERDRSGGREPDLS